MTIDISTAKFLSLDNALHLYNDDLLSVTLLKNKVLLDDLNDIEGLLYAVIADDIRGNILTRAFSKDHYKTYIESDGKLQINLDMSTSELINFIGDNVSKKAYITIWLSNIDQDKHNLLLDDVIKIYNVYGDNI